MNREDDSQSSTHREVVDTQPKNFLSLKYGLFSILLIGIMVIPLFWHEPFNYLKTLVENDTRGGLLIYMFLMVVATVVAPITLAPLIPVAGAIFGPLVASIASIIAWEIGSGIAFIIARKYGRPAVRYFLSDKLLVWYQKIIPEKGEFWAIVFLRMMLPVDVLSYALGIVSTISFKKFMLATLIGIIPFSFIYTYAGKSAYSGDITGLVVVLLAGVLLFGITLYSYKYLRKNDTQTNNSSDT
ncbi:MAG: VTT domain-containing protein [Candidatus Paceibacterota bacterium]